MTTIAYRDGVMAADTVVTNGGCKAYHVHKVRHIGMWLVGLSGTAAVLEEFDALMRRHAKDKTPPSFPKSERIMEPDDGIWALVIHAKSGEVWRYDKFGHPYPVTREDFYASGSGMDLALGAMFAGADAATAVAAAIKYDSGSGGTVETIGELKCRKK